MKLDDKTKDMKVKTAVNGQVVVFRVRRGEWQVRLAHRTARWWPGTVIGWGETMAKAMLDARVELETWEANNEMPAGWSGKVPGLRYVASAFVNRMLGNGGERQVLTDEELKDAMLAEQEAQWGK